jgi:DNA-binding MarR family transcriptional regulator
MSYFGNIYNEGELPTRAKAVYMYLKDRSGIDNSCWPALKTIAGDLSLSKRTVQRALDDLLKAGLVKKDARHRVNNSLTSNLYTLL